MLKFINGVEVPHLFSFPEPRPTTHPSSFEEQNQVCKCVGHPLGGNARSEVLTGTIRETKCCEVPEIAYEYSR